MLALFFTGMIALLMWAGDSLVVSHISDGEGAYLRATIVGRDVAPGDPISIRVQTVGGLKTVIQRAYVELGGTSAAVTSDGSIGGMISSRDSGMDDVLVKAVVPATTPVDTELLLKVYVDLEVAQSAGRGTFTTSNASDAIELTLTVRSASGRNMRMAMDVGLAVLAWFIAFAVCYVGARWRPVGDRGPQLPSAPASDGAVKMAAYGMLLGIMLVGVIGDLVFVRTLQRISSSDAIAFKIGLLLLWALALVAGVMLGLRARTAELRWWPARFRAVIGTPPLTDAFRAAASTLPPSLSRDVEAKPLAEIVSALTAAGFSHAGGIVSHDGVPVARIKAKNAVRPEQLALDVFEGYDATPLAQALTTIYGPLELSSRFTPAIIVNPT